MAGHFRSTRERFGGVDRPMLARNHRAAPPTQARAVRSLAQGASAVWHLAAFQPGDHARGPSAGTAGRKFWTREKFKGTNALKQKINPRGCQSNRRRVCVGCSTFNTRPRCWENPTAASILAIAKATSTSCSARLGTRGLISWCARVPTVALGMAPPDRSGNGGSPRERQAPDRRACSAWQRGRSDPRTALPACSCAATGREIKRLSAAGDDRDLCQERGP